MTIMTPSEALVETMVAEDIKVAFGIVGSAYMDALDLFPAAGIRFISVAHEQAAAHAADGRCSNSAPGASSGCRTTRASALAAALNWRPPK